MFDPRDMLVISWGAWVLPAFNRGPCCWWAKGRADVLGIRFTLATVAPHPDDQHPDLSLLTLLLYNAVRVRARDAANLYK